jgi:hypothetical protein
MTYNIGEYVQIVNHAESECNGQYGYIKEIQIGYDGMTRFYTVELEDTYTKCTCIDDEMMEG